jgi:hypothetical protein
MSEWWTYSLSDFLLFSSRTYYRLFALYNEAVWPAHIAVLVLVCAILLLLHTRIAGRPVAAILAVLWAWVAGAFHAERYATINWAAIYFAWGFAIEAALLLWAALVRPVFDIRSDGSTGARIAIALFVFSTVLQPVIAFLVSRDSCRSEIFGLAPDPTAAATLALLAMVTRPPRYLFVIPLLWCLVTALTLIAMEAYVGLMTPVAGALALAVAVWKTAPHEARRH